MSQRFEVIGCEVTGTSFAGAVRAVVERATSGEGGYVCFTNVHVAVMAHQNRKLRAVLAGSFMTVPDGKPLYWVGRVKGIEGVEQVPGPDFLPALLGSELAQNLRHFFYGSTPEVLEQMMITFRERFPAAQIAGWESPPFRPLSPEEDCEAMERIRHSGAHIVWVGLGAPKQELWMAGHVEELKPAVLMGVGAAFDFHAGMVARAPGWMRSHGLEWLHRLSQEPGRLWKRYLVTNTLFIYYLLEEWVLGCVVRLGKR